MIFPEPKNRHLKTYIFSLKKRSKAIKYKCDSIQCERVIENFQQRRVEKIETEVQFIDRTQQLRLFIWEDRWIWLDARKSSKSGWVWEWEFSGRVINDETFVDTIKLFERTIEAVSHNKIDTLLKLEVFWEKIVATGPKLIK